MPDFDNRTTLGADGARPSMIPTPEEIADAKAVIAGGEAALVIEGERVASLRRVGAHYVMSGRGDRHPLRVDATDEARLVAHWHAFRWAVSNQVAAEALAWKALITPAQRREMLANGACRAAGEDVDPLPVVALFTPDAQATWLLSELDPEEPDFAFGLCDLGLGLSAATPRTRRGSRASSFDPGVQRLPADGRELLQHRRPVCCRSRGASASRAGGDDVGPG